MTSIQVTAAILLALRLIAVGFLLSVVLGILTSLKKTYTQYEKSRIILACLVLLTFAGNFLPIAIDSASLFGLDYAGNLLIPYAFSNAITAASSGIGWWMLRKQSEIERTKAETEHDGLVADNKALTKDNKALKRR